MEQKMEASQGTVKANAGIDGVMMCLIEHAPDPSIKGCWKPCVPSRTGLPLNPKPLEMWGLRFCPASFGLDSVLSFFTSGLFKVTLVQS